ncbi:agmatine deiminase family protein [Geopsychrobacter electrodiphilus]|uniref:agmatine deiminase family protein n=1 Tax=Geopsychrobacter electrodiphilus TaxID=225196 RepID=UPI00035DD77B|nr:agmatine deiminase family protein [Geopsychrobacter electrodiphilus]
MKSLKKVRLPAEWEAQDAVLLAWPHEKTDWVDQLASAQRTFIKIIKEISRFEVVLLIVHDEESVRRQLQAAKLNLDRIHLYQLPYNDTWARDFGPLGVQVDAKVQLLDFIFNGWGNKFCAEQDNQISQRLAAAGAFGDTPLQSIDLVLEGGSIESDGAGTLLTTSACLLEQNRNPQYSQTQIEAKLKRLFGVEQILWLEHGVLQGDDTDSHIDTLARFVPHNTIIFQGCGEPADEHYSELAAMREQLARFRNAAGEPYQLLTLPWPAPCYDGDNNRLPATYANFLIINDAVLVPTYMDPADAEALRVIAQAFPERQIVPVNCRALIEQHGSLHCVTMQFPKGVLK